jgi:hypothetical protein
MFCRLHPLLVLMKSITKAMAFSTESKWTRSTFPPAASFGVFALEGVL